MSREANSTLAASSRLGAKNNGMRNTCELLINVVSDERPKMLTGLDQNGEGYGWDVLVSSHVIDDSPGE